MNCDQVIHLFTLMCLAEDYGGGGPGGGLESILQAVVWFTLSKPMLNLHSTIRLFLIHVLS